MRHECHGHDREECRWPRNSRSESSSRRASPPGGWILQHDEDLPTYWVYGHLEVLFALEAPHRLQWFQLEHTEHLKGDGPFLGDKEFDLDLDGLNGGMRPSELLRQRVWKALDTYVTIETKGIALTIGYRGLHVIYDLNNTSDEDAALLEKAIEGGTIQQLVGLCDRCGRLDSIYSYPDSERDSAPREGVFRTDGARYLRLLR
jgi:hypothetical protein